MLTLQAIRELDDLELTSAGSALLAREAERRAFFYDQESEESLLALRAAGRLVRRRDQLLEEELFDSLEKEAHDGNG